jgi:hypothetical protein
MTTRRSTLNLAAGSVAAIFVGTNLASIGGPGAAVTLRMLDSVGVVAPSVMARTAGSAVPPGAASGDAASGDAASGDAASGDAASGEAASRNVILTDADSPAARARSALDALSGAVRPLSHPRALEDAFRSYFTFKAANPGQVRKPYLYFVDYGQPSTARRGYVFDMEALRVVRGPFTVAHGRGSSSARTAAPTRFSNMPGSAATSLGLYLAQETYAFRGTSAGARYSSVGLRLAGVSGAFNDNARRRGVVAHGAPYVTATVAGRSEGCPAMEQHLARELLPRLANGGMVFLFAPDERWMAEDPWIVAGNEQLHAQAEQGGQGGLPR